MSISWNPLYLQATPIQFFRFEHEPIFRYTVQCEQSISDAKEKIFPDKKQLVVDIIIDESGNLNKVFYRMQEQMI